MKIKLLASVIFVISLAFTATAQSTEFTYQGSLKNSGTAATGNFDFEFGLYSALTGGTQLGSTIALNSVAVANGTFAVNLDFGSQYPGAGRYLEIRVRLTGQPGITTLAPRQLINSTPYAVKSLTADTAINATNSTYSSLATSADSLGGIPAAQYVQTNDARLSDARLPLPGSPNYVQNTTSRQFFTSFNISGDGNLGGTLAATRVGAGNADPNTALDITGAFSVRGAVPPPGAPGGQGRIYFDTTFNRFKVSQNGGPYVDLISSNGVTGSGSTGTLPIWSGGNALADSNIFQSGNNVGIGSGAGSADARLHIFGDASTVNIETSEMIRLHRPAVSGIKNTNSAGIAVGAFETGILGRARMDFRLSGIPTNSNQFGIIPDVTVMSLLANGNVGIGTDSPGSYRFVVHQTTPGAFAANIRTSGLTTSNSDGLLVQAGTNFLDYALLVQNQAGIERFAVHGDGETVATGTIFATGSLGMGLFSGGGNQAVCWSSSSQFLGGCSSSLRYKKNIGSFLYGLDLIKRLKPITFDWKDGGMHDLGLGAEDVEKIEPLLVTYNKDGQVEGVKYDRIGVVLVNAVKEQQAQIEEQKKQIAVLMVSNAALNGRLRHVESRLSRKSVSGRRKH